MTEPMEIPVDIDRIATDLVRARYPDDLDYEWEHYKAIAGALLAERMKERVATPAMIEAGRAGLARWNDDYEFAEDAVTRIFAMMEDARLSELKVSPHE